MIRLSFTPEIIDSLDTAPETLLAAIRGLNSRVPLSEVFVELRDAPTRKYLYRITTSEPVSRMWKQFLYIDSDPDLVGMTFDISDIWQQQEFVPHREIRDEVIAILVTYPTLVQIKYDVT